MSGYEQIEVVTKVADWIRNRGLLDEIISAGVRRSAIHVEVSRRSAEAGIGNALSHVIVGPLAGAADIATTAAGLPSTLTLKTRIDDRPCRIGIGRRGWNWRWGRTCRSGWRGRRRV